MSDKIVLLEFVDEVDSFLHHKEKKRGYEDFTIVALSPQVQLYLMQKNLPFKSTLEYLTNNSHERCLLKSEELYKLLEKNLDLEDEGPVKEGFNNFILFNARYYLHHLLYIIELLYQINEKSDIHELCACIPEKNFRESVKIGNSERYLGELTREFAKSKGIRFSEIPLSLKPYNKSLREKILSNKALEYLAIFIDKVRMDGLAGKEKILLATRAYNFNSLAVEIKKEFEDILLVCPHYSTAFYFANLLDSLRGKSPVLGVYYRSFSEKRENSKDTLIKKFEEFVSLLERELKDEFIFHGLNFSGWAIDKIKTALLKGLVELHAQTRATKDLLDKINPALIISPFSRDVYRNLAELADSNGIPSICISHGSLVPPKNRLEEIDNYHIGLSLILNNYAYHCIQSPLAAEYASHYNVKGEKIETGNLIFAKIARQHRDKIRLEFIGERCFDHKIVLQANTLKNRTGWHPHWVETFDEYVSGLTDLINAVSKLDRVYLIIKLHPGAQVSAEDMKKFLPESGNYMITDKGPFWQILGAADFLVSFGSTAIEDALQNKLPVFLYDKWGRYMHCEAEKICDGKKPQVWPIYYCTDPELLQKGVEWVMKNHSSDVISAEVWKKYIFLENKNKNFVALIDRLLKRRL